MPSKVEPNTFQPSGGWAALAGKKTTVGQAAPKLKIGSGKPLAKPAAQALADGKIRHVILDAGAFVSRRAFYEALGPDVNYLTTRRVLDEIKDKESRRFVDAFPYRLRVKVVSDSAKRVAAIFCKASRDLHNLSAADLEIVALAYMIEKETHDTAFLNLEPKTTGLQQAVLDQINKTAGRPLKKKSVVALAKTRKVKPLKIEEYLAAQPEPKPEEKSGPSDPIVKKELRETLQKRTWKSQKKGKKDVDEDDTMWITPDNIDLLTEDQLMAPDPDGLEGTGETSNSSVACLTTDYQIQNALYQMNIRLLSVNGKSITTVHQWALRCYSCFEMEKDTTRRFCKSCGYTSLQRVSIWLDNSGEIKYKICQRKRFQLKGTIHNIPNPKGGPKSGRRLMEYINTEDDYREALRKATRIGRKQRRKDGCSNEFGSVRFNVMDQVKIGAGSKNPNKSRGRRKRKKN